MDDFHDINAIKTPTKRILTNAQPRSQGSLLLALRSERETLEKAGHVSPRIWEITNKRFGGRAGKCEICLYRA